jgi:hypothetical protein
MFTLRTTSPTLASRSRGRGIDDAPQLRGFWVSTELWSLNVDWQALKYFGHVKIGQILSTDQQVCLLISTWTVALCHLLSRARKCIGMLKELQNPYFVLF